MSFFKSLISVAIKPGDLKDENGAKVCNETRWQKADLSAKRTYPTVRDIDGRDASVPVR